VQRWTLESLKKLNIATLMKMCEDFGAAHGRAKKEVLIRRMTVGNYIQIVSSTDDNEADPATALDLQQGDSPITDGAVGGALGDSEVICMGAQGA
jgi:hypothetical protein